MVISPQTPVLLRGPLAPSSSQRRFPSPFPLLEPWLRSTSLPFSFTSSPTVSSVPGGPHLVLGVPAAKCVLLECNSYLILLLLESFELSLHFLLSSTKLLTLAFKALHSLSPPTFQPCFPRCPTSTRHPHPRDCLRTWRWPSSPHLLAFAHAFPPTTAFPIPASEI